jgi:molybdopterin converting factor subunit 1
MKEIRIEYYAQLREERGLAQESRKTSANTAAALYRELAREHGLSLPQDALRVAVNRQFAPWDTPIAAGDTVVFLPPVSGG